MRLKGRGWDGGGDRGRGQPTEKRDMGQSPGSWVLCRLPKDVVWQVTGWLQPCRMGHSSDLAMHPSGGWRDRERRRRKRLELRLSSDTNYCTFTTTLGALSFERLLRSGALTALADTSATRYVKVRLSKSA